MIFALASRKIRMIKWIKFSYFSKIFVWGINKKG